MPEPTLCHRPLANCAPVRTVLIAAVLALPLAAAADSSLTARLLAPVAGPGLEQTAELVLHFFPGDGEAIVQVVLAVPTDQIRILRAVAVRGATRLDAGRVLLDYAARPIGAHDVDTVAVTLQALRLGSIPWSLTVATNVDSAATVPRRFETPLRVQPPAVVTAGLEPTRVYPGEVTRIAVTVVGRDASGQPLAGIDVAWPEGLQTTGTAESIARGDTLRSEWPVRVSRAAGAPIGLTVTARVGALRASPVHVPPLRVAPLPVFAAAFAATALVGQETTVRLRWDNPGTEAIAFAALTAEVPAGCAHASLVDRAAGARLEADEEKGSLRVQVAGPGQIDPGQTVAVDVRLTPSGSGPFAWSAGCQPPDRPAPVPLRGAVVTAMGPAPTAGLRAESLATDLELASSGLRRALVAALEALPAPPGTAVAIVADHPDDGNWVVEGLLTELLLARGLRVLDEPGSVGHALHYRLADAEVVYSPLHAGLNPFGASRRRDARAEVFLRLEDPGTRILWTRRVSSRAGDTAQAAAAPWLGGAKGIAQAQVDPDHRAVEFGLSGLIVGGLFFVFFAP